MSGEKFITTGTGQNRREVIEDARAKAAAWFEADPKCVAADLIDEHPREETTTERRLDEALPRVLAREYTATVRTQEWHKFTQAPGKPLTCEKCGAEGGWPLGGLGIV